MVSQVVVMVLCGFSEKIDYADEFYPALDPEAV
jgi:hypothetical protein